MNDMLIEGGRALLGREIVDTSLRVAGREISAVGAAAGRLVHLTEAHRLVHAPTARKAVAAA